MGGLKRYLVELIGFGIWLDVGGDIDVWRIKRERERWGFSFVGFYFSRRRIEKAK